MANSRKRQYNRTGNARRRRNRRKTNRGRTPFIITVIIMTVVALAVISIVLVTKYHKFTDYSVNSTIEMGNTEESTRFFVYGNGYLKCASDGVTYFNEDRVIWSESYSMIQPIIDICGDYIAVADMAQRDVYIYDRSGFVNRINLAQDVMDVAVTQAGVVAVAANDGNVSYLEIKDKYGTEIMNEKAVFSLKGYLMDLALSHDGTKMAAIYLSVDRGEIKSKLYFYDLASYGKDTSLTPVEFGQYAGVLLTNVKFMSNDSVCVVGDTALSFYKYTDAPELIYEELERPGEIQSLILADDYVGLISEEAESENSYTVKVYDFDGNKVLEQGTDFSFSRAIFAGQNVLMYSGNECLMYSFDGIEKFHGALAEHIEGLASSNGRNFVYGTKSDTQFITLK